ncbi:hypothetical protein A1O3_03104 [Capronia epimyces CBS 606.96]|uniref:2-dehydropantoate 2-reductase n=1 Tax=Capronia epimyces CBS 606.96 TaxID=1182542 RepID=W9YLB5_9EURO|nr:uncharacterized protein A1O3_03104 [Capronia epimyces CBS 606.96]EXJ90036.1 hypothetical protein A1O3_03104 [Capronia epimyces CBS 606.96]
MTELRSWWSGSPEPDTLEPPASFDTKPLKDGDLSGPETEHPLTRRIHILGLGSIGTFVAHSLRCLPNPPPITLMIHKRQQYEEFKRTGRVISLINKESEINDEQRGFDVDLFEGTTAERTGQWKYIPDQEWMKEVSNPVEEGEMLPSGELYIYCLIVAVKGHATVSALQSVKHRVDARTTICFMQNGLGQIDELNREVFTDPRTRPTYLQGVVSHGVYMTDPTTVVYAGLGTVALGICRDGDRYPLPPKTWNHNISELSEEERRKFHPTDKELFANLSSRYLLRTLTRSPVLACAAFPYLDLLQLQLEKLALNCVLNPLTALLDVPNGTLLYNNELATVERMLLAEISLVIRGLPELEGIPNVRGRFSAKRLEQLCHAITQRTAKNSSSMREDMRNGKKPELDYINGYIIRRGEEQGVKCALNFMLMQLVKGKHLFTKPGDAVPYATKRIRIQSDDADQPGTVTLSDESTPPRGSL